MGQGLAKVADSPAGAGVHGGPSEPWRPRQEQTAAPTRAHDRRESKKGSDSGSVLQAEPGGGRDLGFGAECTPKRLKPHGFDVKSLVRFGETGRLRRGIRSSSV